MRKCKGHEGDQHSARYRAARLNDDRSIDAVDPWVYALLHGPLQLKAIPLKLVACENVVLGAVAEAGGSILPNMDVEG